MELQSVQENPVLNLALRAMPDIGVASLSWS